MHSASSRFNGITLYTAMVLGFMCLLNFAHGYLIYNPTLDHVHFQINAITNFIDTRPWEQASFKYTLNAGKTSINVDLSPLYTWNLKQLYVYLEFEWTDPATKVYVNGFSLTVAPSPLIGFSKLQMTSQN
jgi:hypothetical protein